MLGSYYRGYRMIRTVRLKIGIWLVRLAGRIMPCSSMRVKLCREFLASELSNEVTKCGSGKD